MHLRFDKATGKARVDAMFAGTAMAATMAAAGGDTPPQTPLDEGGQVVPLPIDHDVSQQRTTAASQSSSSALRLALISDTHLPRGSRALPATCVERLRAADLIIHAGDFVGRSAFDELVALGPPVLAVHGNQDDADLRALLPAERVIEAAGPRIGLIHDAGPSRGRLERMRRRFPDCAAVVFGHSHIPLHETAPDGFQIFNPGSPTDRRRQPAHTMGMARATGGAVRFGLVEL